MTEGLGKCDFYNLREFNVFIFMLYLITDTLNNVSAQLFLLKTSWFRTNMRDVSAAITAVVGPADRGFAEHVLPSTDTIHALRYALYWMVNTVTRWLYCKRSRIQIRRQTSNLTSFNLSASIVRASAGKNTFRHTSTIYVHLSVPFWTFVSENVRRPS